MTESRLCTEIGPLKLQNPVLTASGTFGYGTEYADLVDLNRLGGIVVKGLSLRAREGNPPPRIVETPCGMINAIGLANIGLDAFLADQLPQLRALRTHVIVNIYGHSEEEYAAVAGGLRGVEGISALEINISCPNVDCGGMAIGTEPAASARVTERVLRNTDKPVIVKLSPNVTDITHIARAAASAGAHALSLVNTLTGMVIDVETRRPVLANVSGGLSGPAIRPVALHMVYRVVRAVDIPVIGIGGIMDHRDALQFLMAGARAVQVGTAHFVNPRAALDVVDGLERYCREEGISGIGAIIGAAQPQPPAG